MIISFILVFFVSYLLGSVPFGLILTRTAGTPDLLTIGSGNIGATNVLRTGRKDLAILTLLFDAFKGWLAVVGAHYLFPQAGVLMLVAALAVILGHMFPIWLKFKGGKGVATYIGCLLAFNPIAAGVFALVWLVVLALTRYSSLSALIASAVTPLCLTFLDAWVEATLFAVLTLLLWVKHLPNIRRLCTGLETKVWQKR